MKLFKRILFWVHLVLGVAGGLVIAMLALTGAAMAFEPQILDLIEPHANAVTLIEGAPRLTAQQLLDGVKAKFPDKSPGGLVLSSEPTKPVLVQVAGAHAVSVHPQTGEIVSERTPSNFFTVMLLLHIRLSSGAVGNWIVTVSNVFFILLCITGLYLWWPKTLRAMKSVTRFNFKLKGKAFHWNLHNVSGFWALAVLFIISVTGLMMSYRWASDIFYTASGAPKPEPAPVVKLADGTPRYPLNDAVAQADAIAPGWETTAVLPPGRRSGAYTLIIREAGHSENQRSRLYLHGGTGEVLRWDQYKNYSHARKLRNYVLPLHQGSIGGVPGRFIAFAACITALTLVITGYVLTWKRFAAWRTKRAIARVKPKARAPEISTPDELPAPSAAFTASAPTTQ
ncbi:PepSY-associated TM helix domain-containing protein [Oleiharenicola lentus]|uniref:PepSY-associated TM helix domain-containing protein n=1 Tax=Oleiharenicola lentus TaxID=2508720 RepID=UPI003F66BF7A